MTIMDLYSLIAAALELGDAPACAVPCMATLDVKITGRGPTNATCSRLQFQKVREDL